MKIIRNAFILGVLVAIPATGLAQTPAAKPAPAPAAKSATPADKSATPAAPAAKTTAVKAQDHATKGVVKSVDAKTLVITTAGAKGKDMTFVVESATVKTGTPAVGATVEVRYKTEGKQNIATAVMVADAKKK